MKVHHIGYLVSKLDRAVKPFIDLGFRVTQDTVRDEGYGVDIMFLQNGETVIELVSPISDESVVKPLMKRQKNSPYHICYECEDLEAAIDELRAKGFVAWADPHVAPALGKSRVCFLIHPHAGMIELYETKDK